MGKIALHRCQPVMTPIFDRINQKGKTYEIRLIFPSVQKLYGQYCWLCKCK